MEVTASKPSGKHQRIGNIISRSSLKLYAAHLSAAIIIVLVGESIFRGVFETWEWLLAFPATVAITVMILATLVFGVQIIASFSGSIAIVSTLFWLLSFASRAKVAKLGVPATPTDLLLSKQYLDVSYIMWGSAAYVAMAGGLLLALAIAWWIRHRSRHQNDRDSLATLATRCVALAVIVYLVGWPDYNYHTARYRKSPVAEVLDDVGIHNLNFDALSNATTNGQLLAFLMNARSVAIHPPSDYGALRVRNILAPYTTTAPCHPDQPDVVVIMSEAFWDPRQLPGIRYSNALLNAAETTQQGKMFSPVFGGYTANTEFEALSSISNALLPVGSIPYVQYVTHPTHSLATDFASAGYSVAALHPFDGKFWNRRNVYENFGFNTFDDRETFSHRDMTGPFINDHALAGEIIDKLTQGDGPHFVFAVSLQGHAPYTGGMYRYADRVVVHDDYHELTDEAKDQLSTYASGVRDAVAGFNEIVNHAHKTGRPTIVVMFGDHLPALGDDYMLYRQTGYLKADGPSLWTAADQERMHEVPLLVWTNTERSMAGMDTVFSPIYLAYRIKKMADLPLDPIDHLMQKTASEWPILSQVYSKNAHGISSPGVPSDDLISDYATIAYDLLFGQSFSLKPENAPSSQ